MKMRKRGWVYLLIGVAIYVGGILANRPFVVRGTGVPFGPVVAGLGVIILLWDYFKARKETSQGGDRGDPPTSPP